MRPNKLTTLPWLTVVTTLYSTPGPERTLSCPVTMVAVAAWAVLSLAKTWLVNNNMAKRKMTRNHCLLLMDDRFITILLEMT